MSTEPEFRYSDLLPTGADDTPYRLVTTEGVSTFEADGQTFLRVSPEAIQRLTTEAMHDISHYLRPAHLAQLRKIIDDPESSGNDRFVALDLLKNVNISAGGVLPMCQDTGTAIVMGKKSEGVLTGADDGEAISRGVYDAYTKLNLRYSQLAPLTMWDEKNTGTNLPAQIEIYSTPPTDGRPEYKFLFMAKGGGSANKSFLFQETKRGLQPPSSTRSPAASPSTSEVPSSRRRSCSWPSSRTPRPPPGSSSPTSGWPRQTSIWPTSRARFGGAGFTRVIRAGERVSSKPRWRRSPGSSSRRYRLSCFPTTRRRCGATSWSARAASIR